MKISDMGEFGLIERLTQRVIDAGVGASDPGRAFPLLIGIGDDTAAWRTHNATELSTTDTVVDGVHFTPQTTPWKDLGWKVMAANLSDIAAMGGIPLYALVTLGLPDHTLVSDMDSLYDGMIWACREHGAAIVGGDIVRSPTCFVSVTLNGYTNGAPMRRTAAKEGDLLAVTGQLGGSRGGLELLLNGMAVADDEVAQYLQRAHRHPEPRLREGRILAEEGVLAAVDISDGLLDDAGKFMTASGLAAALDAWRVPVHPLMQRAFPSDALGLALAGGEDYELLYAAPGPVMERTLAKLPNATVVGRVVAGMPGKVAVVDESGQEFRPLRAGWDHFR